MSDMYISDESVRILKLISECAIDESSVSNECLSELEAAGYIKSDLNYVGDPHFVLRAEFSPYRITERGRGFLDYLNREAARYDNLLRLASSAESIAKSAEKQVFEIKDAVVVAKDAAEDSRIESKNVSSRFWINTVLSVIAILISLVALLSK